MFNLSGVDLELYFNANTAANLSVFTFLVIPPMLLCLVCVLALVYAKEINIKIKVLLINIFAAEICYWLHLAVFYVGWPLRYTYDEDNLCKLFISIFNVASLQKGAANAIYAINVYLFIKHGEKKLKWYVIITYIIVSWLLSTTTTGLLPYLNDYGASNLFGFCRADAESPFFRFNLAALITMEILFLAIEFIFCILVGVYIKRNVLDESSDMKKAVAKVQGYLIAASILSFIISVLPAANPILFKEAISNGGIVSFVAVNYTVRLFATLPAIATPVVAIILLKPVRVAVVTIGMKVCQYLNLVRTVDCSKCMNTNLD